MLNYVETIRHELRARISDYDDWGEDAGTLLDLYALLVVVKGRQTTLEDIHDSWSLWTNRTRPDHRSLVPFDRLAADIAEYDRPYMTAVHEVSAMLLKENA